MGGKGEGGGLRARQLGAHAGPEPTRGPSEAGAGTVSVGEYQDYLVVRTHEATEMYTLLLEQGTNPHTAQELAMDDLLTPGFKDD
jgi:hypothetical protein